MSDFRWFRLYHDMPFDQKLRHSMNPTQWWAWVCVMCIASGSKNRGTMSKECAKNVLADTARITEESAEECIEHFVSLGLLRASKTTYSLVAWENRQFPSDSSTPRVKRYRERSMKRFGNLPESESDTEIEEAVVEVAVTVSATPQATLPDCLKVENDTTLWLDDRGGQHKTAASAFWASVEIARNGLMTPKDMSVISSMVCDSCPPACPGDNHCVGECLEVLMRAAAKSNGKPSPMFRHIAKEDRSHLR